jgi:hypothetical protein
MTRGEHYNILLTRGEKRATESPRATQQSPYLAAVRISRKKDRNHGIHKHERGINAAKGETLIRARKSRALSQLTDRELEDRDPHARSGGGNQE